MGHDQFQDGNIVQTFLSFNGQLHTVTQRDATKPDPETVLWAASSGLPLPPELAQRWEHFSRPHTLNHQIQVGNTTYNFHVVQGELSVISSSKRLDMGTLNPNSRWEFEVKVEWAETNKVPLPVHLKLLWDKVQRENGLLARKHRTLAQVYQEIGRIIDLMPDNGSIHTSYINTDDGRPRVPAKAYLRELQLDLDRYIPRRTADGRFERRKPR